jgi:hypothetical protein
MPAPSYCFGIALTARSLATPNPVNGIDQPHIASMRGPEAIEPGLGTGRAKSGETRGVSVDNLIGGSP